jgi:ABC-type enterochelin transport system permease subunit
MTGHPAFMLNKEPAISTATFKQTLFNIVYLTAITVAMVGWLSVFGWVVIAVGRWLLA